MKLNLYKLLPFVIILLFLSLAQNILACQCRGFDTPYESYKKADAVFLGKVIGITDESGKAIIKNTELSEGNNYREREGTTEYNQIAVQEWFKGEQKAEVIVSTSINMCEHGFTPNETYLVYAYKSGAILETYLFCSRTYFINTDVFFLRELLANKPEPRIYGSVSLGPSFAPEKYLEKIKIIAQKGKQKFITFTDKNGLYRFLKLPDGKYKIYSELPNKYILDWSITRLEEITLQKNREEIWEYLKSFGPSAYSDFTVRWNNSVSGRVLDAEGKQVDRATIRLLQPNQVNDELLNKYEKVAEYVSWDNPKRNLRKYIINGKAPGNYFLALEIFAPFSPSQSKLRMYYPQTSNLNQAEIITLGQSTQRTIDLKLPDGFYVREIEGIFRWGSGVPIEGGWVSLEKLENSDNPDNLVYESQRTETGNFKFQVFENAEYWIHGKFGDQNAKPIKVRIGKTNEPIKLCITLIKGYKPDNCSNN